MAVCPSSFQGVPLSGGTITGNLAVTGTITGGSTPLLQLQAATPVAGFAFQNATPTILSWTAPNDGKLHRVIVLGEANITVAQTGGGLTLNGTMPDGTAITRQPLAGGLGAGNQRIGSDGLSMYLVQAGSTVTLVQTAAQTAGAGLIWAEMWAS